MRSRSWAAGTVTVLSCFVAAYACGCLINTQDDCELGCIGSGGASTTSSGTSIVDPSCIPSEATGTVENTCGIFASSSGGDDTNPGTKELPVKTIGKAIELASAGRGVVYGCAEDFQESVDLTSSVHIYGGLDCANGWAYIGDTQKTKLTALPDAIPLKIESGISATIQDLHVLAAAAMAPGGSSIAVIADGATAKFLGSSLEAADGKAGPDGVPFTAVAAAGENGVAGGIACSGSQVPGPEGPANTCGSILSLGGTGGPGNVNSSTAGLDGSPMGSANGGTLLNGNCTDGAPGDSGGGGTPGANASGLGTIDKNGYTGVAGTDGTPGAPGQGGGGGGGSKGGTGAGKCPSMTSAGGASGGSGASGGCGGLGGRGGGAGGASIAVISVQANLTFESSQIIAKNGGMGGGGGPGQTGGAGGAMGGPGGTLPSGATALLPGCAGGRGGGGGNGGPGGNGLGGHSIGIAFTGTAPTLDTATTFTTGAGATGGMKQDTQEFP
jgi:hypothetical protein